MARPPRLEIPGALYHVTARGNERRAIFRDDTDRSEYLDRIAHCRKKLPFELLAYCLMTNHVHLAIRRGSAPLSRIMARLHSTYAEWFNRRHGRVGHLFQGRYKAFFVRDDRHLYALVRYIHRNPVQARLVPHASHYPWSSDPSLRKGKGPEWLAVDSLLALLDGSRRAAVRRYVELVDGPAAATTTSASDEREALPFGVAPANERPGDPEDTDPIVRQIRLDDLLEIVAGECGLTLQDLRGRLRGGEIADARCRAAHLARRFFGIPLRRVALRLGRDDSSFARPLARLEQRLQRDAVLHARMQRLAATLKAAATTPEIRNQD